MHLYQSIKVVPVILNSIIYIIIIIMITDTKKKINIKKTVIILKVNQYNGSFVYYLKPALDAQTNYKIGRH